VQSLPRNYFLYLLITIPNENGNVWSKKLIGRRNVFLDKKLYLHENLVMKRYLTKRF
jgi:hypothetical protein